MGCEAPHSQVVGLQALLTHDRLPSGFGHFVPAGGHLDTLPEDTCGDRLNPGVPARLPAGDAVLRRWDPSDAPLFDVALEASRSELLSWTPWVLEGVGELAALEERLRGYKDDFDRDGDLLYAVMDVQEASILGGAGLYRRVGEGALEIGYWIRSDRTGQGLATQASRALTALGFGFADVQRVEIHCRADNLASIRIPKKLGFELREAVPGTADRPGTAQVWVLSRGVWEGRAPDRVG